MLLNAMRQVDVQQAGLSLLFAPGARPDQDSIVQLMDGAAMAGVHARVSHRPQDDAGWLELLASGFTFDLSGLAPDAAAPFVQPRHEFGFAAGTSTVNLEAVTIEPSGHIAAGAALPPVVRTLTGLVANIALNLPVEAVLWHPSGSLVEPRYFSRVVLNWLAGGAFPVPGLASLIPAADGSIASDGLAYFIGQEMQLEGKPGAPMAETAKLAIRIIDYLVRHGALTSAQEIDAGGETLLAEPAQVGKRVLVWRES